MTVCLGGKAAATNRGTSLKNLIREGAKYNPMKASLTKLCGRRGENPQRWQQRL